MNLDEKIIENRKRALALKKLSVGDLKKENINKESILCDIKMESQKLKVDGVKKEFRNKSIKYSGLRSISKKKIYLQKLNYKLSRYAWFKNGVKPFIKKIYRTKEMKSCINVKQLLIYQDSQFVEMCYINILKRQADEAGYRNNLVALRLGELSKIDIICNLRYSEEGMAVNVSINGIRWRMIARTLLKKIFAVPIIGKACCYIYNIVTISRNVTQMKVWNINQDNYLRQLDYKINVLENKIDNQINRIDALKAGLDSDRTIIDTLKVGLDSDRTIIDTLKAELDSDRTIIDTLKAGLDSDRTIIDAISENVRNNNVILEKHEKVINDEMYKLISDNKSIVVELCNLKAEREVEFINSDRKIENANLVREKDVERKDDYFSIDYFDFENHFRGSREHIKEVQKIYLPYFEKKKNVIDLGCGRCEFLELLKDNGIKGVGVDLFPPYVEYAKMQGLNVYCGDAIEFLKKQQRVGGIFVGQVVEHISIDQIVELCQVAYDKLEKGGYLIMETPNPTTLAIFTESFYIDPSHNKPMHPKTLDYLVKKAGFEKVEVLFTESSKIPFKIPKLSCKCENIGEFNAAMGKVSDLLFGSQDYAVIARK